MIAAVLQSYGLKVGLYTSPHYTDFRERIKVNGEWISEDMVVSWVEKYKGLFSTISPSFFEITVAMAFDYFRAKEVDIAIIETGLGGRLDSTNIISPELSVITNISMDHQNMLGDTIYQIAGEKAGIIKEKTPVVIGRHQVSCDHAFIAKANIMQAPISWANLDWQVDDNDDKIKVTKEGKQIVLQSHQGISPFHIENCITALEASSKYLSQASMDWDTNTISSALNNYPTITNYIGRWQVVHTSPLAITDSAHNVDALRKVISQLKKVDYNNLHMVIGMVSDKDISKLLSLLPKEAKYYFVKANIVRALAPEALKTKAKKAGLIGDIFEDVMSGYHAALKASEVDDLIYVGGSSFVAGDLIAGISH